jgi:hypothetical protein
MIRSSSSHGGAALKEPAPAAAGARRPRAPRYRLVLPAFVQTATSTTYMNTFSVSRGGCGLSWSGQRPRLGSVLYVRLGGGRAAASLRAMVCWARDVSGASRVGVRFVGGEEAKLAVLLAQAAAGAVQE